MRVGIVGAGAIAMGSAVFLLERGHSAAIWSPSGKRTAGFVRGAALDSTGAIEGAYHPRICAAVEEVAANDVVMLALPANGHRAVLDALAPHIEPRHCVIISGHLSFAALYLAKRLAGRGIQVPIIAWSTTALTSRALDPTTIKIGVIRSRIDIAALPVPFGDRSLEICRQLFGDRFRKVDDMLTIALSNLNPQSHLGIALCNLTRIERGESWDQNGNVTPTVARLLEALDRERLAIAAQFGRSVRTIIEHLALSYGVAGGNVAEVFQRMVAKGLNTYGPKDIATRYITEDVPFGLVPTVLLARLAGIDAPLHASGINLLSACYGTDFTADNDLLPELELSNVPMLLALVNNGFPVVKGG